MKLLVGLPIFLVTIIIAVILDYRDKKQSRDYDVTFLNGEVEPFRKDRKHRYW